MRSWYIKSNFYARFSNPNKIFEKKKEVTAKTPFFVIRRFCTHYSIFLNTLAYDRAVFHGNIAWPILVPSVNKRYSSFFKSICLFQKIFFKDKVLKTFKISSDCHIKSGSLKWRAILKIPRTVFWKNLWSSC